MVESFCSKAIERRVALMMVLVHRRVRRHRLYSWLLDQSIFVALMMVNHGWSMTGRQVIPSISILRWYSRLSRLVTILIRISTLIISSVPWIATPTPVNSAILLTMMIPHCLPVSAVLVARVVMPSFATIPRRTVAVIARMTC